MIIESEQKKKVSYSFFSFRIRSNKIICEAIHLSKGFDFMSFQRLKKISSEEQKKAWGF